MSSFAGTADCAQAQGKKARGSRGAERAKRAGRWRACVVEDGKARQSWAELGRCGVEELRTPHGRSKMTTNKL